MAIEAFISMSALYMKDLDFSHLISKQNLIRMALKAGIIYSIDFFVVKMITSSHVQLIQPKFTSTQPFLKDQVTLFIAFRLGGVIYL